MIMQQPNSEDSPTQNRGFLSELCVFRGKKRRIVMLGIFLVGIVLIIVGVYCGMALDNHKHKELGLILLLSCIAFGVIFACLIVCFARFLRSPRDSLSSLEASPTTSRHVRTSNKSNAIVPVPAFCNSEENIERHPLQRGVDNFKHRNESQSRPVYCDSDIIEYKRKICRESPNYIHRLPRRTRYNNCGSTDDTRYDAMEYEWQKARLMDYRNTYFKSYCGEINRRDLGENQLWSRRNMYKSEHEPINSAKSNEFISRTDKISKSRTRSRSETREYRTKSNKELKKSLYLSTRRTKGTKKREMNASKGEMEMKDYEIRGKGIERVSRRKSNKNEYFFENDKATIGSKTDFSNESDDRAEIKRRLTDRSAGYPQTNAKTISEYRYIWPQTTEPTSDYQSWQRHHFVHSSSSSSSESEAISYPSKTCSDSSMQVGQYASRSSRNVATNLPKYKADLNYASTSGIGQIYIPEGKRNVKLQHPLSENAILSKRVAQHFHQYAPNSSRYSEQSPSSARKEYGKYLAMQKEKHINTHQFNEAR